MCWGLRENPIINSNRLKPYAKGGEARPFNNVDWFCTDATGQNAKKEGWGGGRGGDQPVHVAQLQYILHILSLPPFVPTTVLGQKRYCVAAIWGQIDALKTPLSTLKYLHLNFTQINRVCVCVPVCVSLCASLFGQQKLIITINWKWQPQPLHNFPFPFLSTLLTRRLFLLCRSQCWRCGLFFVLEDT